MTLLIVAEAQDKTHHRKANHRSGSYDEKAMAFATKGDERRDEKV